MRSTSQAVFVMTVVIACGYMSGCASTADRTQNDSPKRVAEAGDVQVVDVPKGVGSASVEFIVTETEGAGGTATSSIVMHFGTTFVGHRYLEAHKASALVTDKHFAPGRVLIELRPSGKPGMLFASRDAIFVDPNRPTVLSIEAFDHVEDGAKRKSMLGHGIVGDINP